MSSTNMPRVGVIGAGAIGCTLAARFAHAGCLTKLAARGHTADVLRRDGVRLTAPGAEISVPVIVADAPRDLDDLDYVFVAVKQQDLLAAVAHWLPSLPSTVTVVPAINGVPWWFFPRDEVIGGKRADTNESLELAGFLPDAQVLGVAVYLTAYTTGPGTAIQGTRNRLVIGEPDGSVSSRARRLREACIAAGMDCEISADIRRDVWMKVVGNAVFNPLSVLSGANMAAMLADAHISRLALDMLRECLELGRRMGLEIDISAEERLRRAGSAGAARTSMLQDYLKGKPLEVEALIGRLVGLGNQYGFEMPFTAAVYGLTRSAALNNPFATERTITTEEDRV